MIVSSWSGNKLRAAFGLAPIHEKPCDEPGSRKYRRHKRRAAKAGPLSTHGHVTLDDRQPRTETYHKRGNV